MSKMKIDAADGGGFSAYVATPPGGGKAPGVVVILEIRGVNANLRAICDDYASRGYLAVAPDLLWRIEPDLDSLRGHPRFQAMMANAEARIGQSA